MYEENKMSDRNLVLSNECKIGVPGTWLAQPGRFNPFVSLAFPDSWRLLVSSPSGENVGPEVGWAGGPLVQFHLKQTEHSLVSSEGSLGSLLREQRKVAAAQIKGGQKTQNGLSVAFEKINLKTCFRPEEANLFSRSGWGKGESKGKLRALEPG